MVTVQSEDVQKRQTFNTFQVTLYYRDNLEISFVFKSHQDIILIARKPFLAEIVQPRDPRSQKFNDAKGKYSN